MPNGMMTSATGKAIDDQSCDSLLSKFFFLFNREEKRGGTVTRGEGVLGCMARICCNKVNSGDLVKDIITVGITS